MFSFGASGNLGKHDPQKERAPPPPPTPLSFPQFSHLDLSNAGSFTVNRRPSFFQQYIKIKRPSDITQEHFSALNVSVLPAINFEYLVSGLPDGLSHLPSKSWLEISAEHEEEHDPSDSSGTGMHLKNDRSVLERTNFKARLRELYIPNHEAYRLLSRTPIPGDPPARLVYFRNFWQGLNGMAYYWDTSLDEYIPLRPPKNETDQVESIRHDPNVANDNNARETPGLPLNFNPIIAEEQSIRSPASSYCVPITVNQLLEHSITQRSLSSGNFELALGQKGTYRGLRVGTGYEMPVSYRLDTIRGFLEPIVWSFGLIIKPHRRQPLLSLRSLRLPILLSNGIWRIPTDREKAKTGQLEGPVCGVLCRNETAFPGEVDERGLDNSNASLLDLMREISALLLLTQERNREGRKEKIPGEDQWWTIKPKWISESCTKSDEESRRSDDKGGRHEKKRAKRLDKMSKREKVWKNVRCRRGYWDPKVTYQAIGRNPETEYDEVFLVSSLNHHLSLLKMRVHPLYLQYLTEETLPTSPPPDPKWSSPTLERTRWYDLFNVDDRVEAMRGIWGVMSYFTRA